MMRDGIDQPANLPDSGNSQPPLSGPPDESRLVEMLRDGDEGAFLFLVEQYQATMLHLALIYVPERAIAEEIVQEAWVGVLQGLHRFERRSSLKTWIFRILTNCAKTRSIREKRSVPFSSFLDLDDDLDEPAVAPDHFWPPDSHQPGQWISQPMSWNNIPEEQFLSQETMACIVSATETLPPGQRAVLILHDIEGWKTEDICHVLGLSETNQRVLLHRARSKVRRALEQYLTEPH